MNGSSNRTTSGEARGDGTDVVEIGLVVVCLLSALAGAVDAYGLSILKDLFVSFMSGNTTSLGLALGSGDLSRARLIASIVGLFTVGAAAGGALAILLGRYHLPGIVAVVAVILTVPILAPPATVYAMAFAMGALNAAMERAGSVNVSITYVTGTLVKLGRGLGEWLCGHRRDAAWLQQAVPWVGIFGGALLASLGLAANRFATMVALPALALFMAAACLAVTVLRRPGLKRP